MDAPFQLIAEVFLLECIHQGGKTRPIFFAFCWLKLADVKKGDKCAVLLIFTRFMGWMGELFEFALGLTTQHNVLKGWGTQLVLTLKQYRSAALKILFLISGG